MSLPDTAIPVAAMTEKDRSDLEAALDAGVDWIALSFVQRPEDVAEVKKVARGRALVMSKLEKPQAIARLDEIIEISDAVMVARGDLGVEMPLEKVPGIQKRIVRTARQLGKPVVVATQMLESMITSPVPTRAEVSDVATAVYDGADAVMLSAESASGQYPIDAVATMNRIAEEVEQDQNYWSIMRTLNRASRRRRARTPSRPALAPDRRYAQPQDDRGLDLLGLDRLPHRPRAAELDGHRADPEPEHGPPAGAGLGRASRSAPRTRATSTTWRSAPASSPCARASRQVGERIIIVAGMPFGTPGATNMVRIAFISQEHAAKA